MFKKQCALLLAITATMSMQAHNLSMDFGINFNYANYQLDDTASQGGYIAGPHFNFSYKSPQSVYTGVNFDGRWNAGLISTSNENLGGALQANIGDYITDWEIGYHYLSDNEAFSAMPYTGLGFQHLAYEVDPSMVRYKYYQLYIPIGLQFLYNSIHDFSIGFGLEYRPGAYNRLRVKTPNVDDDCNAGSNDSIKLKFSHGVNLKMPIVLHYCVEEPVSYHASFVPYFDWNTFSNTRKTTSDCILFPIPKHKRWYLGINANFSISF